MIMNKKGFELSINMIVVIVLGIIVLGMGIAIFNQGFSSAVELREDVSQQTKIQLNRLLDDGSLIVVPFPNKDGKRGDPVYYDMAIANELGVGDLYFSVVVSFSGVDFVNVDDPTLLAWNQLRTQTTNPNNPNNWALYIAKGANFLIPNNERAYVPIAFDLPRKIPNIGGLPKGQYVFNVDVCRGETAGAANCDATYSNRHHTRQKLYITVN